MAAKQIDSPSSLTSPQSLLLGLQAPPSPAKSLKPRYLKMTASRSIDLVNDLNPINRLRRLSSFGSDSFMDGSQSSQGDERKIAQIYETKLKRLQQKVTDLTRLYRESERETEHKLQFWQNKFLTTFQTLKSCQTSDMSADTLQQLSEKIKGLEQQMTTVLTQGEEEEMGLHRFNRELLSKLKKSHQEKRELVDQLTQFQEKFLGVSGSVESCVQKLGTMSSCKGDTMDVELENARSTVERLVVERAELEEGLFQLETVNNELREELVLISKREGELVIERDRVSEKLLNLEGLLQGGEEVPVERDQLSLIDRLEGLNGEIELLRRQVEAKGRVCVENIQKYPIQPDVTADTQQESREELTQLQTELLAAREKIHNQEDTLFKLREDSIVDAERGREVASLQERLYNIRTEMEQYKTETEDVLKKKSRELEACQEKLLESNQQQTELLQQLSTLQQLNSDKTRSCEQLDRQVTDLSKALQACLEMQEQLVESFQTKQKDIDKLTGQANTLQRELSKSTDKNMISNTQLQALNQRLHVETEQVKTFEKKLRDATREKNLLQQQISQFQFSNEKGRSMTSPDSDIQPTRHSYPYLSEEPIGEATSRQLTSSLPVVLPENKGSPNFSQNYRRALQKGLGQVELSESASKLKEDPDNSPDTKLYWVRRVSEMSLQMKESSEYWSAQVKQLTLQLEQAKHSDTDP